MRIFDAAARPRGPCPVRCRAIPGADRRERTAMPTKGLLWGSKMTIEDQPCCTALKGAKPADRAEAAALAASRRPGVARRAHPRAQAAGKPDTEDHRLRRSEPPARPTIPQAPTGGLVADASLLRRDCRSLRGQHGLPDLGARRPHDTAGRRAGAVAIGPPCRRLGVQPDVRRRPQRHRPRPAIRRRCSR